MDTLLQITRQKACKENLNKCMMVHIWLRILIQEQKRLIWLKFLQKIGRQEEGNSINNIPAERLKKFSRPIKIYDNELVGRKQKS
jgi:hypothetical protein